MDGVRARAPSARIPRGRAAARRRRRGARGPARAPGAVAPGRARAAGLRRAAARAAVPGRVSGVGAPTSVTAVYVHAPFCARRCVYCAFAVKVRAGGGADEWARAIGQELAYIRDEGVFTLSDELASLYVGGGTPSLLGPGAMAALRDVIGADRLRAPALEWTAEANPESFDRTVAEAWRAAGVNRVSLGVQTFHEPTLRWMGRLHGPHGGVDAVRTARAAGIENLSVDLIFGLPGHLGRSWTDDLDRAVDLGAPHVSLYGLSVESGTAL